MPAPQFSSLDSAGTTTSQPVQTSTGRLAVQIHNAQSFTGHLEGTLGGDNWSPTGDVFTEARVYECNMGGPGAVRVVADDGTCDVLIVAELFGKR